jgi:hypothetical protein
MITFDTVWGEKRIIIKKKARFTGKDVLLGQLLFQISRLD